MSRLIETIRCENGEFPNLNYHKKRMERSLVALSGADHELDLALLLKAYPVPPTGVYKCRVVYDNNFQGVEFIPYITRAVRSLKLVSDDGINYDHKWEDRSRIEQLFGLRGTCDDVLIVKQGRITDSSIANVVFFDGETWFTPGSCLLEGTMRQNLLDKGKIKLMDITIRDIPKYKTCKLINAMLQFDSDEIPITNLIA